MFPLKHAAGQVVLVADIDDMSVGVSIVDCSHGSTVLAFERKRLPIEDRSPDHGAAAITQCLEEVAGAVIKKYTTSDAKNTPKAPQGAYAIVRAPWTHSRTVQAEEFYPEPRAITQQMIDGLAKKALTTPSDIVSANRLESNVLTVYLNGYPTPQPLGKRASRISVTAFESDIDPGFQQNITRVLGALLPGRECTIHSSMCALLSVLHEYVPNAHRFVVVDIAGSVTQCAVILKETMSQSAFVPEGMGTILKRLSTTEPPEALLTQLRMLADDSCSTDACKALKDSLARAEPDMTKVFGEAFASLSSKRRLPNIAMLSAPAELAPWLQGFFSKLDFSQFTTTQRPFTVEELSTDHLHEVVHWTTSSVDTGLGVAAAYVNILGEA